MPPLSASPSSRHDSPIDISNLLSIIQTSKTSLDEWVQREKSKADAEAEAYHQLLKQEQRNIDNKSGDLLAIKFQRGMSIQNQHDDDLSFEQGTKNSNGKNESSIAARRTALTENKDALEQEVDVVQRKFDKRRTRLEELEREEAKQRARAEEAHTLKARVREAKQTTVDDLTRGMVYYKYLGLDFEKSENENGLRITYTQLDPSDPSREFSFFLVVTEDNRYDVIGCEPALDYAVVTEITDELNRNDDTSCLIREMRRAFAASIY